MIASFPWGGACQDSVSECAKSPSHPYLMSELQKGKEVGWVLRLNKGTEENWVGRGRAETKPLRKAEQSLIYTFYKWASLGESVWELPLV